MKRTARFGHLVTAMVTPFRADGSLDVDAALEVARFLEANESEALVVAGTTGETPVLSDDEKVALWSAVSSSVRIPVIAGATTNDTAHSIHLTKLAESAGAAAILAVTPYYNRPSQEGLFRHFSAVAEATALPVMLYDIPIRTGRKIASATTLKLARHCPNVVALKDASGDPVATSRFVAEAPPGFEVYSGDDSLTLALLAVGAVGVVSVAGHWIGPEIAEMIRAFLAGDVDRAAELNCAMVDAVAFQSSDEAPNPQPAKAILRAMGLPAGECRLPHGEAPPFLAERASELCAELARWRSGAA